MDRVDRDAQTRAAGRGGVAVLGAKVFFILIGFVQQALLARVIGESGYGALSRALAMANPVNNVVVSGATQGVSRTVARARGFESQALRATLRVHAPLAAILAALFVALSPLYVWWQKAPYIQAPLFVMGGVVLLYGIYAPLIGALNGRARFTVQAGLDVTFAVLRTVGMLGLGYAFAMRKLDATLGACLGFVLASGCILPIALRVTGIGTRAAANVGVGQNPGQPASAKNAIPSWSAYLLELLPMSLAQLGTNLLMQVDLQLLGHFASSAALAEALSAKDADRWVAYYKTCQLFAFLPYQLLMSITQVLFPMLARANAEGDQEGVRAFVTSGARLGAIAAGFLVSVIAALPAHVIGFAFGTEFVTHGTSTLRILVLGQGAFAMLGIAVTVLTSLGQEVRSMLVTAGAVFAVVGVNWILLRGTPLGDSQLERTALATSLSLGVALLVAYALVRRRTGGFVPVVTAARVALGIAMCMLAGSFVPPMSKLLTPVLAIGIGLLYVGVLVVTRELRTDDLKPLRTVLGRKK